MARPYDPDNPGDPGEPGYVPPPDPGSTLAVVVTSTSVTFTAEQIAAAGGPWPSFTVRVTPINDAGSGPSTDVEVTVTP